MNEEPDIAAVDAVLIGKFNPGLFSASWFARHHQIREEEAQSAEARTEKVRNEVFHMRAAAFELLVLPERFSINAAWADAALIRDLVVGTFRILEHTPVTAFGINANAHYRAASLEEWHKVGDCLAPKQLWNQVFPDQQVGMSRVQMKIERGDTPNRHRNITVQPSAQINPGIFLAWNDHHEKSADLKDETCRWAVEALTEAWDAECLCAFESFQRVLQLATR
jgi:hypothetical protein